MDHRADIYSLGVVFYEMLTGELPLGKFAAPSTKVQVDVRLDEVVLHTLEKEPSRRYQHASQVKSDVETITGTSSAAAARAASASPFSVPTKQTASNKAILPAFLLAFPFGMFGAHRFYAGKIGTALLQLGAFVGCILMIIACATTGAGWQPTLGILLGFSIVGCFIWAVTDWILILCKAFTDGQGRRMSHWFHPQNGNMKTGTRPITGPPSSPPPGGAAPPAGTSPPPPPTVPDKSPVAGTGMIVAPAVGLMVAALWKLLSALTAMLFLSGHTQWLDPMLGRFNIGPFFGMADAGLVFFKVVPALFILFGALQMLQLRSYTWSIAASILAIVACSLIGLPMGIWALIVLARQDVRDTFAHAARSGLPKANPWPWVLGIALVAGAVGLIAFTSDFGSRTPDVTVSGVVTDAITGQPIAGARVDDNRAGADTDKTPAQTWTDAGGHYELKTWSEEHTIAASAPGYEPRLSALRTKIFNSRRNINMDFRLEPESRTPLPVAGNNRGTNGSLLKETAISTSAAPSTISVTTNAVPAPVFQPVRIEAGASGPFVDHDGNLWLPDQGFADGQIIEHADMAIANTTDPEIYRSERYGMTSFSYPVPNGKYLVKLHFAETYNAITGPGERVFTFIVEGHEFKDFDVWAAAGGAQRAYVTTISAEVTDGVLDIYFIPQQQNPQINGIEILPAFPIAVAKTPLPPAVNKPPVAPPGQRREIIANLSTTDPFQQEFNRTLPLSANGRLSLDNVNGRIEIAGWERNEVSIKALKHGKTQESVEAVKINVDSSPNDIVIHTVLPPGESGFSWSQFWSGDWGKNDATVDYLLRVPRHAHLGKIESVNGQVEIEGVTGNIEASAVNGGVRVRGAAGSLKLSNVNGRIEAELDSLGNGQSVSLNTVNGQIEASLPSNADATVTASTINGSLNSEFPALVVRKDFPLGKNLKGTLGNGSASVKADTVNGGIRFRQSRDAR